MMTKRTNAGVIPEKDSFDCHHCGKRSKGRWCMHCSVTPVRGTYWDEFGFECKPTARIKPPTGNEVNTIGH
jgi:hypothetical protein